MPREIRFTLKSSKIAQTLSLRSHPYRRRRRRRQRHEVLQQATKCAIVSVNEMRADSGGKVPLNVKNDNDQTMRSEKSKKVPTHAYQSASQPAVGSLLAASLRFETESNLIVLMAQNSDANEPTLENHKEFSNAQEHRKHNANKNKLNGDSPIGLRKTGSGTQLGMLNFNVEKKKITE
ncbi:unnamed protein product [Ceratitis capitata]|uniref:(Mediterranean fruit fly) hypothetical protein n=1 Tax=Ceratitis capitata TaxID=7213 RepID=A0A811UGL3_CERCA|nr:unnamed protein product [Ceratitis capitata]